MFVHNLNPVLLSFGPLEIRYYGIAYVLGFFFSVWWLQYWRKIGHLSLTKEEVWDFVFYLMVGVLVGSRLFMIFWQPQVYLLHPFELLKIWQGGMSFHGGFVGIIVAGLIYCKKKKIKFLHMADLMSVPAILALGLGRIANFMNAELVGRITNVSWCIEFPYNDGCRHPSTLYAAAKRFLVFGYLTMLSFMNIHKSFRAGFIFWNFVLFEGIGRFIVDFYRFDTVYFSFSLGQWFSLVMIIVAVWFMYKNHITDWKKIFFYKKGKRTIVL